MMVVSRPRDGVRDPYRDAVTASVCSFLFLHRFQINNCCMFVCTTQKILYYAMPTEE